MSCTAQQNEAAGERNRDSMSEIEFGQDCEHTIQHILQERIHEPVFYEEEEGTTPEPEEKENSSKFIDDCAEEEQFLTPTEACRFEHRGEVNKADAAGLRVEAHRSS